MDALKFLGRGVSLGSEQSGFLKYAFLIPLCSILHIHRIYGNMPVLECCITLFIKKDVSMQKTGFRSLISGALLVSALAVLTGCDLFKQSSCPNCGPSVAESAKAEDVLLSIDGVPAVTKQQFEDFYEVASAQAGPYGALSKKDAFETLKTMEILNRKISQSGKDQDPAYKKDFARAHNLARWGVNSQIIAKEIQETIDTSDAGVESFYNQEKGKNPAFDRPPFLKSPESVSVQSVEFSDKKAAEEFLKKAKSDFAGAARGANLSIKDLGKVSPQSQNVDFAVRLKARTLAPNAVELVPSGDKKFFVIKAGTKSPAQYAEFKELVAMPQMKEMLAQFKKQVELEPAFLKRVEEYKKDFKIDENLKYFEEEEAKRKEEEDKLREIFAQKMKEQETAAPAASAPAQPAAKPQGVVAG